MHFVDLGAAPRAPTGRTPRIPAPVARVDRPKRRPKTRISRSWPLPAQQLQQTGMPFIIMQQPQPECIMAAQHSQQAWIIAAQLLSPLVQVMQTPLSVGSHLHMPIVMLQQQTIMPFIIMQQLHMPAGHHRAQILKHSGRDLVVADAGHLHSAGALLERHLAPRDHHHVGSGGARGGRPRHPHARMPITFRSAIIVFMVVHSFLSVRSAGMRR